MDELEQKTKKRVKAIVKSNLTGLSMMQEGWYLSYLPLNVVDKLPAVSLKPLPIELGRRRHRTGLIMRRSSRALSAFVHLKGIIRDVMSNKVATGDARYASPQAASAPDRFASSAAAHQAR